MWPESSSVNAVNSVKKICYNSCRDIGLGLECFPIDCFVGSPCIRSKGFLNPCS